MKDLVSCLPDPKPTQPNKDEAIQMDLFTDRVSERQWIFNEAKTLKALEKGANLEEFHKFLVTHDPQPLPEKMEGFIKSIQEKANSCTVKGTCLLLDCYSTDIAEILASHPETKNLCQRVGDKGLVLGIDNEKPFRTALHKLGYGMPLV